MEQIQKDHFGITPFQTVLHRCEASGCCSSRNLVMEKCVTAEEEQINIEYTIYRKFGPTVISVTTTNHTVCECRLQNSTSQGNTIKK